MKAPAKVLIVDDDAVVGQSFNRVLTNRGYEVRTASNGEEALAKFNDQKPDVVFTDIKMPGMDGIEVAQRIKAISPATPIVVATGYGSAANEEAAAAVGVVEFLRKPVLPETIENLVDRLTHQQARRSAASTPETVKQQLLPRTPGRTLADIALFFAGPLIGLVYFIGFPFVGLAMLAWAGYQALTSPASLDE